MGCVQSRVNGLAFNPFSRLRPSAGSSTGHSLTWTLNEQAECVSFKGKQVATVKACASFRALSEKPLASPPARQPSEAGAAPLSAVFSSAFTNSALPSTRDSEGLHCTDCIKAEHCPEQHDGQLSGLSPEALKSTSLTCVVGFSFHECLHEHSASLIGRAVGQTCFADVDGSL